MFGGPHPHARLDHRRHRGRTAPRRCWWSAPCSSPARRRPSWVTRAMLALMKPGRVLIDVAIDQGGCFETSHPTTHADPTFEVDGIIHYCVANMPGAVPLTASHALNNATLPYGLALAAGGYEACFSISGLREGLNVHEGPTLQRCGGGELWAIDRRDGRLTGARRYSSCPVAGAARRRCMKKAAVLIQQRIYAPLAPPAIHIPGSSIFLSDYGKGHDREPATGGEDSQRRPGQQSGSIS